MGWISIASDNRKVIIIHRIIFHRSIDLYEIISFYKLTILTTNKLFSSFWLWLIRPWYLFQVKWCPRTSPYSPDEIIVMSAFFSVQSLCFFNFFFDLLSFFSCVVFSNTDFVRWCRGFKYWLADGAPVNSPFPKV